MTLRHAARLALAGWYLLVTGFQHWGIDLPAVIAFLVSVPLAMFVGDLLVPYMVERAQRQILLPTAKIVGHLEQIVYVFAVIESQYELIAGWLILKGFLGWIPPRDPDPLGRYHAYLLGNGYSLLVGLAFGVFSKCLAFVLRPI